MILNLERLNESVENSHFKMDNIHTSLKLITKDCWLASLDLKDAYYSVPIHAESQKILKFSYKGKLFQFTAFPNGLSLVQGSSQNYSSLFGHLAGQGPSNHCLY